MDVIPKYNSLSSHNWCFLMFIRTLNRSALTLFILRQVTRDYDEEEQGYDSEKEAEEDDGKSDSDSASASSPKNQDEFEKPEGEIPKKSKLNGDDHHQEDMEMSDWDLYTDHSTILFSFFFYIGICARFLKCLELKLRV